MTNREDMLKIAQADLGEVATHLRNTSDALDRRNVYRDPRKHARMAIVVLEEIAAKLKRSFLPNSFRDV